MKAVCVVAALSAFAVLPSRLQASPIVIYDNFGPGLTYNTNAAWDAAGPNNTLIPGNQYADALSFTPSSTLTFDAVLMPLSYFSGTNSAIVNLTPDVSGQPGATPLESFSVSGLPTFPNGNVFQLNSVTNPVLTAGDTYWITFFPGASNSIVSWFINSTGALGIGVSVDGGSTWDFGASTAPAMEVLGNQVSTPEPSSLAMLAGLGACIIGRLRRRIGPIR
jgi:hypothetical protein